LRHRFLQIYGRKNERQRMAKSRGLLDVNEIGFDIKLPRKT
jgi:hypothetical protein